MTTFSNDEPLTYEEVILELAGNPRATPGGRLKEASPEQVAMLQRAKEVVSQWTENDYREAK